MDNPSLYNSVQGFRSGHQVIGLQTKLPSQISRTIFGNIVRENSNPSWDTKSGSNVFPLTTPDLKAFNGNRVLVGDTAHFWDSFCHALASEGSAYDLTLNSIEVILIQQKTNLSGKDN